MVGLEPLEDKPAEVPDPDAFVPSQEAVPAAALEIEKGNLTSLGEEPEGESMDLAALQAQLNADAAAAEAVSDDAPPTMTLGDDIASTQETAAVRPNGAHVPNFSPTGARAWRGCEPMTGDVDITKLVEEFAS